MIISECEGYKKLLAVVVKDLNENNHHDYQATFDWVIDRAKHYAEKTGLQASDILDSWEKKRSYWYMNYYQECNQPLIESHSVKVFETVDELMKSIGNLGFRCPMCGGVSKSPYECDSGLNMEKGKICDWKVYGLFRGLGKDIFVFVKEKVKGEHMFMPVAWEKEE
jgi:hypothetical protein